MYQEIIVYIIGITTAVYLIYKAVHFFTEKEKTSLCAGCPGCKFKKHQQMMPPPKTRLSR